MSRAAFSRAGLTVKPRLKFRQVLSSFVNPRQAAASFGRAWPVRINGLRRVKSGLGEWRSDASGGASPWRSRRRAAPAGGGGREQGRVGHGSTPSGPRGERDLGNSSATISAGGTGGKISGGFGTSAGAIQVTVTANANLIDAGASALFASIASGVGFATIYGGFGSTASAVSVAGDGSNSYIDIGDGAGHVSLNGSSNAETVVGSFDSTHGALSVFENSGVNDVVVDGTSDTSITVGSGTSGLEVIGGSGSLSIVATDNTSTSTIFGEFYGPSNVSVGAGSLTFILALARRRSPPVLARVPSTPRWPHCSALPVATQPSWVRPAARYIMPAAATKT